MIYKIFREDEWQHLKDAGETDGAPIDLADGFIHFSDASQAQETAAKHFAGATGLWLAAIDETILGDALKWEVSRGDALFPHLFRALKLDEIVWCVPLPLGAAGHEFPGDMV